MTKEFAPMTTLISGLHIQQCPNILSNDQVFCTAILMIPNFLLDSILKSQYSIQILEFESGTRKP